MSARRSLSKALFRCLQTTQQSRGSTTVFASVCQQHSFKFYGISLYFGGICEVYNNKTKPFGSCRHFSDSQEDEDLEKIQRRYQDKLTPPSSTRQINVAINTCRLLPQLRQVVNNNLDTMDFINVSSVSGQVIRLMLNCSPEVLYSNEHIICEIYGQLDHLIVRELERMDAKAVSSCMYNYGRFVNIMGTDKYMEYGIDRVFGQLMDRAVAIVDGLDGYNISNIFWATAKVKWNNSRHIQQLADKVLSITDYTPSNLSNIAWALASLDYQDVRALQHIVDTCKQNMHQMDAHNLASILWALAHFMYYDKELMQASEKIVQNSQMQIRTPKLLQFFHAFVEFGLQDKENVLKAIVSQFLENDSKNAQDYAVVMCALGVLDCPHELMLQIVDKFVQNFQGSYMSLMASGRRQIRRAQLEYESRGLRLDLPSELEKGCAYALQRYTTRSSIRQDSFQDQVFGRLQQEFPEVTQNVPFKNGEIELHMLVQGPYQSKVAIQIIRNSKYFVNEPSMVSNKIKSRVQLLTGLGLKVVEVSEKEWENEGYQEKIIEQLEGSLAA
eukprot:TRINITY_DN19415_c0_g2_i1.p1 TRINITY_DN19415_c0_g2~~TRINITY_DN19415_c0_g2_i1.p1  ORF type:complete len:556 (-),score=40.63 TRINITY_DN19415_c0_g2_i1:201-1868(-)